MIGFPDSLRPFGTALKYLVYLLRDEFTTAQAAPITSPRTCEPGPGTLTIVQNNNGQFSISGDYLTVAAASTVDGLSNFCARGASLGRNAGRVLVASVFGNGARPLNDYISWSSTTSPVALRESDNPGIGFAGASILLNTANGNTLFFTTASNTEYQVALVMRNAGQWILMKGGTLTSWTLLWVDAIAINSSNFPFITIRSASNVGDKFGYMRVYDLQSPFNSDFGFASQNVTSPVSGTTYAATADGIFDLTVSTGASLSGKAELRYRVQDANNYWTIYLDSAGALKIDSVNAGTPSNRLNVAGVAVANQTYTIRVLTTGNTHTCWTLNGSSWTRRTSSFSVTTTMDSSVNVQPVVSGNYTTSKLEAWPRTDSRFELALNPIF